MHEDKTLFVSKATLLASSATGILGALTVTEWAAVAGIVGTAVASVCTVYLTRKRNAREQAQEAREQQLHQLRVEALEVERRKQLRRKSDVPR